mmetsp:Transcript_48518/g.146356  ORF Transcript_48518/g.146356 Transcript_48518/m.146356 type:complete len:119 (-) Transcript_48518:101-457(-)
MGRVPWINAKKLGDFILKCQDNDDGGIADRPSDMPDVFHTFFGVAGLSLIGHLHGLNSAQSESYQKIDPVYALPTGVVQTLGLKAQIIGHKSGQDKHVLVDDRLLMYDVLEGAALVKK